MKRTDRSYLRDTDSGLSPVQLTAIRKAEAHSIKLKKEKLTVVDRNGDVYFQKVGGKSSVTFPFWAVPTDSVITHNHPVPEYMQGPFGQIGLSLSGADIRSAINGNAKEVRAVTSGYIFSIRRPKGGWGARGEAVKDEYDKMFKERWKEYNAKNREEFNASKKTVEDRRRLHQLHTRGELTICHNICKELAAKYGFTYTRRKNDY